MKNNRIQKISYVLVAIVIIAILLINDNGVIKYFKLKNDVNHLNETIETTKKEIKELKLEIDSLKTSDSKIEKVAREKYRMKYENETPVEINEQ